MSSIFGNNNNICLYKQQVCLKSCSSCVYSMFVHALLIDPLILGRRACERDCEGLGTMET